MSETPRALAAGADRVLTSGAMTLKPGHPAAQIRGVRIVGFSDGVLRLAAEGAGKSLLVIHAGQPVILESMLGGRATLRPGWDGTIEYSHYRLELDIPAAGDVTIRLRSIPPSSSPASETEADLFDFRREFQSRPSRFPNDGNHFNEWQNAHKRRLVEWLMGGGPPRRVPLEDNVVETADHPKFVLHRVRYRTREDRASTLLLSVPKGLSKAPVLLALHGHEAPWGQADANAYKTGHADDFIACFAERGWAVLQPATMDHRLQHKKWTLQGEWTWDAMVAIDYAATRPELDAHRVGVCGLSTGAHLAMNVLALDDRVKAGVVAGILSTWNHYRRRFRIPPHCDCGIMSQLGSRLEPCDWAALAAPKPVQYQHGRKDAAMCPGADPKDLNLSWNTGVMPEAEYETLFAEVRRAYELADRPRQVETRFHDAGHNVDNDSAFAWLSRWIGCPS